MEIYDLDVYRVADRKTKTLSETITEYSKKHWKKYVDVGKKNFLPIEIYQHYLKECSSTQSCEMEIFNDICEWLAVHNGRLKYADELMETVRFPLMSGEELKRLLESDSSILSLEKPWL